MPASQIPRARTARGDNRSWKHSVTFLRTVMLGVLLIIPAWSQTTPSVESPTVQGLRTRLSDGDTRTVDEFWSSLKNRQLPLVEPDPADSDGSLVTFVWRGDSGTKNVVVITPLALIDFDGAVMQAVPGTNVWFKTYRMRNDARMTYRFAENDTLVPFDKEKDFFARMKTWQTDSMNPQRFDVGAGIVASVLELPGAPTDKWTRQSAPAPKGSLTKYEFSSNLLHNHRSVWIYTPANYAAKKSYPVLLIMDGESYTSLVPMPTILDNLIVAGAIPPAVAILVGSGSQDTRDRELNCNKTWSDALVEEVLPWTRGHNINIDERNITIVGDSLAGLAAACAARDYPKVFGKVISQSGSFYRAPSGEEPEWLARHLAVEPPIPVQFYQEVGLLEIASIPNRDPSMLTANRHLRDVLLAKGNQVGYVEHFSGHEHVSWRATIADALIYIQNR